MKTSKLHLILFLILCFVTNLKAQETNSLFNHLYDKGDNNTTIIIDSDYKHLIKHKNKEEYQPAAISIKGKDGEIQNYVAKIRARGNIRKKVCYNPPIKINLKESELEENGFDSLDILKLALQCRSSKSSLSYLAKERLAYDLYSLLDTNHIRAVSINVEFYEKGKLKESFTSILVEEEEHYAQRINAIVIEKGALRSSILVRNHFLKMCFFQYMIGNVDWAIPNKHNVEILQTANKKYIAVPYDFDYSGLVNADYAIPHESLPISKVTERMFMTKGMKKGEMQAMINYFNSRKSDFMGCVKEAKYLTEGDKKSATKYIEEFYSTLSSKRPEREFIRT